MAASSSPPSSQSPPPPTVDAQKGPAVDNDPAETDANPALAETAANSVLAETAINSPAGDIVVESNAANADSDSSDSAAGETEAVDSTAAATTAVADPSAVEAENAPAPIVIRMKPPPSSWTQQETITVVQAYGERWYANKRKPLKGNQWAEIAALVASRGGSRSAGQIPKTPIQCRHKIDKLRKRFRAERHRGSSWNWQYYDLMNRLERGPYPPTQALPSATRRPAPAPNSRYSVKVDDDNGFQGNLVEMLDNNNGGDDMEEDEDDENQCSKSQSIHYILRRPTMVNRFPGEIKVHHSGGGLGVLGLPSNTTLQRIKRAAETEKLEEERERRRVVSELASEIRLFAESYVGVENVKLKMMKEGEQRRMEMESTRMGMILDSQKKIAETIAKAFF